MSTYILITILFHSSVFVITYLILDFITKLFTNKRKRKIEMRIDIFATLDGERTYINLSPKMLSLLIDQEKTTQVEVITDRKDAHDIPIYVHYRKVLSFEPDGAIYLMTK